MPHNELLTVLVTSSSSISSEHLPTIEAISSHVAATPLTELSVGGHFEDPKCRNALRDLSRAGKISTFIDAGWNTSRGAIERTLTVSVKTPYILLIDIGTSILEGGLQRIIDYIEQQSPVAVVGFPDESGESIDMRCLLVNTALLRSTGTYQVPLSSQSSRPTELLQQYLGKNGIRGTLWEEDIQSMFHLAPTLPTDSYHDLCAEDGLSLKPITVCVCAYGDHPSLLARCLTSLCEEPRFSQAASVVVGCNSVSRESMDVVYSFQKRGFPVSAIISRKNLNKSGMRRMMATLVDSKYIASCDDDIFLKPGWLRRINNFINDAQYPGPDAAGCSLYSQYFSLRDSPMTGVVPYSMYALRRKWWRWRRPENDSHIVFPGGCFHLLKTEFIRQHDFPDHRMLIDYDDILLGDLIVQVEGTYTSFPNDIRELVIVDLNPSRGNRGHG